MGKAVAVGPLFVVCWDNIVTVDDQRAALMGLRQAAHAHGREPVMIVVLGASLRPPDAEVRKQGIGAIRTALGIAKVLEVAVTGEGVLGTLQRSTARGVALLVPELRGRVHVHDSLGSALHHAASLVSFSMVEVNAALVSAGFTL